jgi:ankyrin repeat protein
MLHHEYIEYLKRENESNFEESKNYYIKRKLKRFIEIDKKILDSEKRNEVKNKFIIALSKEDFNLKCQENNDKESSIHFLKLSSDNQSLFWQKSRGPISDLNDFIIKTEVSCLSIEEEKILDHSENILIISAESGMGKSLILDKLVFDSNSDFYCFKIVLNNFTKHLSDLKEKKENLENQENILDFTLMRFLEKQNELELSLLKHLAQEQRLILMFDGVDEVVDYKEQVKQLIQLLRESCRFKFILITTRNHLRSELEDFFNTISFSLNKIDVDDQINFLKKYWRNLNFKLKRYNRNEDLENLARELVDIVRSSLSAKISEFIGIPLQTKMIADIYFYKLDSKEDFSAINLSNMADLFDNFVEKKFDIQFEEKWGQEKTKHKDDYEEKKEKFYHDHIIHSSYVLFNKKETDIPDIKENEAKRIVKFGLIVSFNKNKIPTFLHQSYAEYFLAKNAFAKLEQQQYDVEINLILKKIEFFLVRNFLEGLFQKNSFVIKSNEIETKNYNFDKQEIENCCAENLFNLLNYLIEKKVANIKSKNHYLLIASCYDNKEIVRLLIEKEIDINQTNSNGSNALHLASEKGHKEIVQLLMENGINFHQMELGGLNALHLASKHGHKEIVQLFIEKGININQANNNGENALHLASKEGHTQIVQLLIEKGIDIKQTNKYGQNALHLATRHGHKETVHLLIHKGFDVNKTNKYGISALHSASERGYMDIVQLLIEKGINVHLIEFGGLNALHLASRNGHKEIVRLLIEKEIDINQTNSNGSNALHFASMQGHTEIVRLLIENGINVHQMELGGLNALHLASRNGHKDAVQLLIEKGININQANSNGSTALHFASMQGRTEIVQLLIENGINVHQMELGGLNALHLATRYGHKDAVQLLIEKGINIDQANINGSNSLHLASEYSHKEIVQLLIEKGINVNKTNEDGDNALHLATRYGYKEIVHLLIEREIDINRTDKYGQNALQLASRYGHKEIVQLLIESGINVIQTNNAVRKT